MKPYGNARIENLCARGEYHNGIRLRSGSYSPSGSVRRSSKKRARRAGKLAASAGAS